MDLRQKIKELPGSPGIYLMKDSLCNTIYVGKAKNLKKRVSQYFQRSKAHSPKIIKMIQNIHDLEVILTDTELEAFLLECRYIKEIQPMYNSQMKNSRAYTYIKLNLKEKFPRISITAEIGNDGAKYFGPYTNLYRVEQTVNFIRDYYKIRKCTTGSLKKRGSGCLNYELGLCIGVCSYPDKIDEYKKCVEGIMGFFEDIDQKPLIDLQEKMQDAVDKLDFEKAARYREYIKGVKHVMNKQRLIRSSQYHRNIIVAEFLENSRLKLFFIKGNKLTATEALVLGEKKSSFYVKHLKKLILDHFDDASIQSYERLGQQDIDEAQIIYSYLKRNKENDLCFWIPSNWITGEKERLDSGIKKIVDRILTKR